MTRIPAPWQEFKDVAEAMANAAVEALTAETGAAFELGNPANFDPEEMLAGRPTPIRAYVVDIQRPLRDVIIFLTSLGNDLAEPLVAPAVRAALGALDIKAEDDDSLFTLRELVQYDDLPTAIDQCDALFLEASYEVSMPLGDLRMVIGTGLLESATCHVNGVVDPWADGVPADGLALGDGVGADANGARYEFDDGAIGDGEQDGELVTAAGVASTEELSALEAFDRELAAQEAAPGTAIAVGSMLGDVPASAGPTHGVFEQAPAKPDTSRWASLLSGVEVELSAELGRTSLELGDITSLVADRVLTLDQMADEPVTVYVNGTPYATARLVIVDGEYGIEILEVIQQPSDVTFLPQLAA